MNVNKFARLAALLALPALAFAHDTWLVPAVFSTQPGQPVTVRFATSEAFPTSDSRVGPDRIARFTMRTAGGTRQIADYKLEGDYLVASVAPDAAGHAVVVTETKPRVLVLPAPQFNDYLKHEDLKRIIAARNAAGKSESEGRERYRKIAKAILCAGDVSRDTGYTASMDSWLEIIPQHSTCSMKPGDTLTIRVYFRGRPLAGARVAAGYSGVTGHNYPVWITTNRQGLAHIKLDRPGMWFARVLHMVAARNDAEADWHSAFSTLTFEVGGGIVSPAQRDAADIRRVLDDQATAWNRGDIAGYMEGYWKSDSLSFASANGITRGWKGLLERYQRSYPDRRAMGKLTFSDLEITLLGGESAMALGRWQLERDAGPVGGTYSLVLRRFPEGWRIVHDHTSEDARRNP